MDSDTPEIIAQELARYAFISYEDVEVMTHVIQVNFHINHIIVHYSGYITLQGSRIFLPLSPQKCGKKIQLSCMV